jgi:small subunit ribosomal protein S17
MSQAGGSAAVKRRATKIGVVTSNRMDKSVVVRVERIVEHGLYKRYIKRSAKFMAHDERNECNVGDTVEIVESRPLSARKRWRVRRVLRPASAADAAASVELGS